MRHSIFMEWHSQTSNHFFHLVSDNFSFSSVNGILSAIKMFDFKLEASQSLKKSNIFLQEQVSTLSGEYFVLFLLDDEDQISCESIGNLVSFACDFDWVIVGHTFLNCYFDNFLFFLNFLTIASLAFSAFPNNFTLTLTFITVLLNLLVHARTHLEHLGNSSLTFASFTFLDIFTTFSTTFFTASRPLMRDFKQVSVVQILQSDL